MLLSAVSVLVFAQPSSEIPEGLMNNPVLSVSHVTSWHAQDDLIHLLKAIYRVHATIYMQIIKYSALVQVQPVTC